MNHIQTYELAGVRKTSVSSVTGVSCSHTSFACATPVLRLLSPSLLSGHLLPEAFCDSIQAEVVILSSGLDLPLIVLIALHWNYYK